MKWMIACLALATVAFGTINRYQVKFNDGAWSHAVGGTGACTTAAVRHDVGGRYASLQWDMYLDTATTESARVYVLYQWSLDSTAWAEVVDTVRNTIANTALFVGMLNDTLTAERQFGPWEIFL